MADAVRFFADQHYPSPVVEALRRRGMDVHTAQEAGRCRLSDADQLFFAKSQGRAVLTFDSDFVALHRTGSAHAGIVWCPATKYGIGDLIRALLLLHAVLNSADMENHLEYL